MSASSTRKNPLKVAIQAPRFIKVMNYHQRWLERQALLGRPWFILGSAPNPTLPKRLPDNVVYAYVKFAGRSAEKHGLPPADITLLNWWRASEREAGIQSASILRIRGKLKTTGIINRLLGRTNIVEADILREERDGYIIKAFGTLFSDVGDHTRPSNGVAMLAFALSFNIPEIVIAGLSLSSDGYEYDSSNTLREHVTEDTAALKMAALRYPRLTTTEYGLHQAVQIPLCRW